MATPQKESVAPKKYCIYKEKGKNKKKLWREWKKEPLYPVIFVPRCVISQKSRGLVSSRKRIRLEFGENISKENTSAKKLTIQKPPRSFIFSHRRHERAEGSENSFFFNTTGKKSQSFNS